MKRWRYRFAGLALLASLLVSFFLVVYLVDTVAGYNTLKLPFEARAKAILTFFPEGFGFFTKDPQSPGAYSYKFDLEYGWQILDPGPNGSAQNWFGMGRWPRALGVEIGYLAALPYKGDWETCDLPITECLIRSTRARGVVNPMKKPFLCGLVAIVSQAPVPWGWAKMKPPVIMPSQIVRLDVKCSDI